MTTHRGPVPTGRSPVRTDRVPVRTGALWFALLGGPLAWTAHLLASYPLVSLACRSGSTTHLNLITAATALLSAAAALTGWMAWRRLRVAEGAEGPDHETHRRAGFMAIAGAVLGTFFVYVIVVEGLPPVLMDPCT